MPLSGKMYDLLAGIYDKSDVTCDVAISFNQDASGAQKNPCRDLIVAYKKGPTLPLGEKLAQRLAGVTTNRSRLGLLFLVSGMEGLHHKVIISRFPADSGILAEQKAGGLSVSFLERIFMKNAKYFKAVVYKDSSLTGGFWKGFAVDKQINDNDTASSNYWIADFLDSDFLTTAAAGTRRLAIALRNAAKETVEVVVKRELVAAATLAAGLRNQNLSARSFADRMALSTEAKGALFGQLKAPAIDDKFQFNRDEFDQQLAYRTVELDTGGMLTAETEKFDDVFKTKAVDDQRTRFTAEGRVINEKVGKGKVR